MSRSTACWMMVLLSVVVVARSDSLAPVNSAPVQDDEALQIFLPMLLARSEAGRPEGPPLDPTGFPTAVSTPSATASRPTSEPQSLENLLWMRYPSLLEAKDMAMEPDGSALWVATYSGVIRWDMHTEAYGRYTANDGLLGDNIETVFVDSLGRRWFGSASFFGIHGRGGVTRLGRDGKWDHVGFDEGLTAAVHDIAEDGEGNVWLATSQGAVRVDRDDQIEIWDVEDGLPSADLLSVAVDPTGGLWFGSSDQGLLHRRSDGAWEGYGTGSGLSSNDQMRSILAAADGSIYVGHALGVDIRSPEGAWTSHRLNPGGIRQLALDSDGGLYAAHNKKGAVTVLRPQGGGQRLTAENSRLQSNIVYSLLADDQGHVWFGTGAGVTRFESQNGGLDAVNDLGRWTHFPLEPGLSGFYTNDLSIGPDGSIWFAHYYGDGISRLGPDGRWSQYREHLASATDDTLNVHVDGDGNAWIATRSGLSVRLSDGSWKHYLSQSSDHPEWRLLRDLQDIVTDDQGLVWIGGRYALIRFDPQREEFTFFEHDSQGDALLWCMRLAVDGHGNLWVALYGGGLARRTPEGQWTRYNLHLPSYYVYSVAVAPDGGIWAGTDQGAYVQWPDSRWETHQPPGGLVMDIDFDSAGRPWLATKAGGLSIQNSDGSWSHLGFRDGLPSDGLTSLEFDALGQPWFGTYNGVAQLMRTDPGEGCERAVRRNAGSSIVTEVSNSLDLDVFALQIDDPFTTVSLSLSSEQVELDLLWVNSCLALDALVRRHEDELNAGDPGFRNAMLQASVVGRPFIGTQRVDKRIGSRTGTYYAVVRPRLKDANYPVRYRLDIGLSSSGPEDTRTLVLTHEPAIREVFELAEDDPELLEWRSALENLVADPRVRGEVVWDLSSDQVDPAVRDAYGNLLAARSSPVRYQDEARRFVAASREWIWRRRNTDLRSLRYIVLAGDDRIIPHMRVRIEPPFEQRFDDNWTEESDYLEQQQDPLDPLSPVRVALQLDQTLGDDAYGSRSSVPWGIRDLEIAIAELPVGRLVERPSDMVAQIDAFLAREGRSQVEASMLVGHHFMQDAIEAGEAHLARAGLTESSRHRLIGESWTIADLRHALRTWSFDLAFLAMHSTHYLHVTPDDQAFRADEILHIPQDLRGRLVYGLACHGGLNAPGDGHREALDFPEVWSRRGATSIGSTGWAYGYEDEMQYQEDLMAELTRRLLDAGGVAVGEALAEAKHEYFWDVGALNHFHAKTLAGTVLYGLPMLRVSGPEAVDLKTEDEFEVPPDVGVADSALRAEGEAMASQRIDVVVADGEYELIEESEGKYYTLRGQRPRVEGGEPLQPRWQYGLLAQDFAGAYMVPRGVVWEGGTYRSHHDFRPLVRRAGILGWTMRQSNQLHGALQTQPEFSAPAWYPTSPVSLRDLPENTVEFGLREARLIYTLGQYDASTRRQALFDRMSVTVYYTAADDQEPPTIDDLAHHDGVDGLELSVQASDASGIRRVSVVWTEDAGEWHSSNMIEQFDQERWIIQLPRQAKAIVQVVDGAGNVSIDDHAGALYQAP